MPAWLWILLIVLIIFARVGCVGYRRS